MMNINNIEDFENFSNKSLCTFAEFLKFIMSNNIKAMKENVAKGFDINQKDRNGTGYTPLMYSAVYSHLETFKYLLSLDNIDIDEVNDFGSNALEVALSNKKIDKICELMINGANFIGRNSGYTIWSQYSQVKVCICEYRPELIPELSKIHGLEMWDDVVDEYAHLIEADELGLL